MNTTSFNHKFAIGDTIFSLQKEKAAESVVYEIRLTVTKDGKKEVAYFSKDVTTNEIYLSYEEKSFQTKNELIQSIIE